MIRAEIASWCALPTEDYSQLDFDESPLQIAANTTGALS